MRTALFAVLFLALVPSQRPPAPNLNGTWTFSTFSDDGVPSTGTLEITGGPDNYGGTLVRPDGGRMPISDIAIGTRAIYVSAELPSGGAMFIRVVPGTEPDTLTGAWGAARPMMAVKLAKKK
jgi:hypothetical protein